MVSIPFLSAQAPIFKNVPLPKWGDRERRHNNRLKPADHIDQIKYLTKNEKSATFTIEMNVALL
jgi:hypothetical protein